LYGFKLNGGKVVASNSIGWNLKAVFKKSNPPTNQNHKKERRAPEFQVTIPGKRHKNIRQRQK